jgi:glycosyltransferase involved in cell wall biosynthesis
MTARICLYGPERGNGSWSRVTAGIRQGLEAIGELAGFCPTDDIAHDLDGSLPVGFDAPIGVHVGPPGMASVLKGRGSHEHRLSTVAANSTWLPIERSAPVSSPLTGFIAPSTWAKRILEAHQPMPVYLWHHGVSAAFRPRARERWAGYRVLHMASTHFQRKTTRELIEAWAACLTEGAIPIEHSMLRLVCDGPRGCFAEAIAQASRDEPAIAASIVLEPRRDLSEAEASAFYQAHDVVCQPSRAEGFGLCPLEARASGVPVIMTACTGHADQMPAEPTRPSDGHWRRPSELGIVVVANGPYAPIDDGPGATAPTVEAAAIADALASAYTDRRPLRQAALAMSSSIAKRWSWTEVCLRFCELEVPWVEHDGA